MKIKLSRARSLVKEISLIQSREKQTFLHVSLGFTLAQPNERLTVNVSVNLHLHG